MHLADEPDNHEPSNDKKHKRPRATGYFTIHSGWTPLIVFRADSLRDARRIAGSDDIMKFLRRTTHVGKPILPFGAKVWVALATEEEQERLKHADSGDFLWLQTVDDS